MKKLLFAILCIFIIGCVPKFSDAQTCLPPDSIFTDHVSTRTAQLNWNPVPSAQGYIVRGSKLGGSQISYITIPGTANSKQLNNVLAVDQHYIWQIQSICSNDTSGYTPFDTFATLSCNAPTDIFTTDITAQSARLNWTVVNGATSYEISGRALGSSAIAKSIVQGNSSTFKQLGNVLTDGKTYEWSVRSKCAPGVYSSLHIPFDTFTAADPPPCLLQVNVDQIVAENCANTNDGAISISVSGSTGNLSYLWSNSMTSQDIANLRYGNYIVTVSDSLCTITDTFYVPQGPPPCNPPDSLYFTNIAGTSLTVNWPVQFCAQQLEIIGNKLGSTNTFSQVRPGNFINVNFTGLDPSSVYEFRIRAKCDTAGLFISPFSGVFTVTTNIPPFNKKGLASKVHNQIDISIYPNPISDFINIEIPEEFDHQEISILNSQGVIIFKESNKSTDYVISAKEWPKGFYMIIVKHEEEVVMSRRIIKF